MFLAGIAVAVLGLLGLPSGAGGPGLRRAAAVVTLAGVAAAGTAIGLASTAWRGPHGIVIPALHDAANDQPVRYTPVCGHVAGIPVCMNPAYGRYLPDVTAALRPLLAEVAGLPGAPARATQVPGTYTSSEGEANPVVTISGRPPVLRVPLDALATLPGYTGFTGAPETEALFADQLRALSVHAFVGAGNGTGAPAQQAVQAALLLRVGVPFAVQANVMDAGNGPGPPPPPTTGPVYAAARRLAALPPAARHAWLAAHLGALRSGHLTLAQLP
jgi:hypothetical protein